MSIIESETTEEASEYSQDTFATELGEEVGQYDNKKFNRNVYHVDGTTVTVVKETVTTNDLKNRLKSAITSRNETDLSVIYGAVNVAKSLQTRMTQKKLGDITGLKTNFHDYFLASALPSHVIVALGGVQVSKEILSDDLIYQLWATKSKKVAKTLLAGILNYVIRLKVSKNQSVTSAFKLELVNIGLNRFETGSMDFSYKSDPTDTQVFSRVRKLMDEAGLETTAKPDSKDVRFGKMRDWSKFANMVEEVRNNLSDLEIHWQLTNATNASIIFNKGEETEDTNGMPSFTGRLARKALVSEVELLWESHIEGIEANETQIQETLDREAEEKVEEVAESVNSEEEVVDTDSSRLLRLYIQKFGVLEGLSEEDISYVEELQKPQFGELVETEQKVS